MNPGPPATILVAPDSFKGTFRAAEVAAALGRGLAHAGRAADLCPVADGGEGTAEALGAEPRRARAHDPLGREIEATFALLPGGRTAVVEVAAASGLPLLAAAERDPERASSAGTGELVLAAAAAGAREILVGAGGSATVDGGRGAIEAITAGGGIGSARLVVLADVATPWEHAARAFGPQKGAGPGAVDRLEAALGAYAAELPRDPRGVPGTGAAGGLAGGLWAALGARIEPGAAWVLRAVGFDARLARAGAVLTGEGRLDATTAEGKLTAEIARRARAAGRPCHAVCGEDALGAGSARALGFASVLEASDLEALEAAGAQLGARA